jgi:glycosyltransferase involved in cell wall biosynthesis
LRVLYQGEFMPDRNLQALILSVRHWTADRRLLLRGSGRANYVAKLRRIASKAGLGSDRVEFLPAVDASELISTANAADIGVHPITPRGTQTNCCLPNKLFEYTMAGLCVVVSPAKEMAALVRRHDLGIVISDARPVTIASAINALSPEMVENYKRNALKAARELNWENERHLLQMLYEGLAA